MAEISVFKSGVVNISEDVLEVIASIAAGEIKGVKELSGTFSEEMMEFVGKKSFNKGVEVTLNEDGTASVVISVIMDFGIQLLNTARDVQNAVKTAVESMTSIDVREVNINIVGINFKKRANA